MAHKLKEWLVQLPCTSGQREHLSAYMDGELATALRAKLEKHLARCRRCRAQYEQMRFASRAVSHVAVPQVRPPAWRAAALLSRPLQERKPRPALERFWTMKINVPAPVAAAALALLFCLAGLLSLTGLNSSPQGVEPLPTSNAAPQIKFVEVPIERERIVTRTVYATAREARPALRVQPNSAPDKSRRATLITAGIAAERDEPTGERNSEALTSTSLVGFRPATDANLRIVKEPEQ